jgi:hypothetical protein
MHRKGPLARDSVARAKIPNDQTESVSPGRREPHAGWRERTRILFRSADHLMLNNPWSLVQYQDVPGATENTREPTTRRRKPQNDSPPAERAPVGSPVSVSPRSGPAMTSRLLQAVPRSTVSVRGVAFALADRRPWIRDSPSSSQRHTVIAGSTSADRRPWIRDSPSSSQRHIVTAGTDAADGTPWIRHRPSSSQRHSVTVGTASADGTPWIRHRPSSSQRHSVTVALGLQTGGPGSDIVPHRHSVTAL